MPDTDVSALAQQLTDHLKDCYRVRDETNATLKGISDEITTFKALPGKALRWAAGIVGTAVLTILTQNFFLHQDTQHAAQQAAQQATSAASTAAADAQTIPAKTADAVAAKLETQPPP
jgi:hypothetical protein